MVAAVTALLLSASLTAIAVGLTSSLAAEGVAALAPTSTTRKGLEFHVETPWKEYLASWKRTGYGDNVAFNAWWLEVQGIAVRPQFYWYQVDIDGARMDGKDDRPDLEHQKNARGEDLCPNQDSPGQFRGVTVGQGRLDFRPCNFQLIGPTTGVLRVRLFVRECRVLEQFSPSPDKCTGNAEFVASDSAFIKSGVATLKTNADLFEEGQKLRIGVRTGSCGLKENEPGFAGCYYLNIRNPHGQVVCENQRDDGQMILCENTWPIPAHAGETRFGHTSWKYFEFTIPKGAFKPRDPTWDNVWHVEILNNVIEYESQTVLTVDALDKAPASPSVELVPKPLVPGTSGHLTVRAFTNPNGSVSLTHARVLAWYGHAGSQPGRSDSDLWVPGFESAKVELKRDPANDSGERKAYVGTTILPIARTGEVQVLAFVVDVDGRPGGTSRFTSYTAGSMPTPAPIPSSTEHHVFMIVALVLGVAAVAAAWFFLRDITHRLAVIGAVALSTLGFIFWVYWTAGGAA